jgi:hypothetical protein
VDNFVGSVPVNTISSKRILNAPAESETTGFRAEDLSLSFEQVDDAVCFRAIVRDVVWLGDHQLVYVATNENDALWVARCDADVNFQQGIGVYALVNREKLIWFDSSGNRIDRD